MTELLIDSPPSPHACFILAHGAGAGMEHPFMEAMAHAVSAKGIATARFNFPSMAAGSRRPDSPAVAQAAVRDAVAQAARRFPGLPLFAGGKSFGGRMTSQAQAAAPLDGVEGLIFVGFPLHPAHRPSLERAKHLAQVHVPMLFLQGTRDALAELPLVRKVAGGMDKRAVLHVVEEADHAFHVLMRSGRRDADVIEELAATVVGWVGERLGARGR